MLESFFSFFNRRFSSHSALCPKHSKNVFNLI